MIELPDPDSIERVADWIELTISTTGKAVSRTSVASSIERITGSDAPEYFLSNIWSELEYRQKLYLHSFFKVQERLIQPQTTSSKSLPEYQACLLLSLYGVQGFTQVPAKLFERITCQALKRYLSGNAVVFGWPSKGSKNGATESQIKRKIKQVADDLNERFCESPPSHFKDRGVDVVGWIPFGEKRSGQVVILLQCAAGHNWKDKNPVPLPAWCQYIHWAGNPIIGFAVPGIVDERDWHDKSKDKGILFDRPRIINLLFGTKKDRKLIRELRSWVTTQISNLNKQA